MGEELSIKQPANHLDVSNQIVREEIANPSDQKAAKTASSLLADFGELGDLEELFIDFGGKPLDGLDDDIKFKDLAQRIEIVADKVLIEKNEKDLNEEKPIDKFKHDLKAENLEKNIKEKFLNKADDIREIIDDFHNNPDSFVCAELEPELKEVKAFDQSEASQREFRAVPKDRQVIVDMKSHRVIPMTEKAAQQINEGGYKLVPHASVQDSSLRQKINQAKDHSLVATFLGSQFFNVLSSRIQSRIDEKIAESKAKEVSKKDKKEANESAVNSYTERAIKEINNLDKDLRNLILLGPSHKEILEMTNRIRIGIQFMNSLHKFQERASQKEEQSKIVLNDYLKYLQSKQSINDEELKRQQKEIEIQHGSFIKEAITLFEVREKGMPSTATSG